MFEYTQEHEEHKNNPRNMISITEYIISNWKHKHMWKQYSNKILGLENHNQH